MKNDIMEKARELARSAGICLLNCDTDGVADLIAAALAEARVVPQWLPIKSQKDEGVWFIGRDGKAVYPCVFNAERNAWIGVVDFCFVDGVLPQEWQPLPAAPQSANRRG